MDVFRLHTKLVDGYSEHVLSFINDQDRRLTERISTFPAWIVSGRLNIDACRADILRIAREYGAVNVRVFGSIVRGEGRRDSDLDLLVEFEPGRSLLDVVGLKLDLEELLDCAVDVATEDALHWTIRDKVLQEARAL